MKKKVLLTKPGFFKFEKIGDEITCYVISGPKRFEKSEFDVFEIVDLEGVPRLIVANAMLKEVLSFAPEGEAVTIRYAGELKTKGGRDFKNFEVFLHEEETETENG